MFRSLTVALLSVSVLCGVVDPPPGTDALESTAAVDNIVYVTNATTFCMLMPREPHTNISVSEEPGGTKTYCSPAGRYSPEQGELPADFWSDVEFVSGVNTFGKRFAQLTGCIRTCKLSRLNSNDTGGQYDSGCAGEEGKPKGSACLGYNHYVELVEPADRRACIKCCDDPEDCPTDKDTKSCPDVIPGNYFNCSLEE